MSVWAVGRTSTCLFSEKYINCENITLSLKITCCQIRWVSFQSALRVLFWLAIAATASGAAGAINWSADDAQRVMRRTSTRLLECCDERRPRAHTQMTPRGKANTLWRAISDRCVARERLMLLWHTERTRLMFTLIDRRCRWSVFLSCLRRTHHTNLIIAFIFNWI